MADLTEVYSALQKADAAGDTAGAKQLADYIRSQGNASAKQTPVNPATDFGGNTLQLGPIDTHIPINDNVQNFLAGAGKATYDLARGAGQMVGAVSRQDVANSRAQDAPLMQTKAGKAGMITGTIADMLPTALIPGAGTLGGAAAIGAGTGLLQPSTSTDETLKNTALGAAVAPASILAGRVLGAAYQGGKALISPFFQGGQERIAGDTLRAFAGGEEAASAASSRIANTGDILPGVEPTTAELANNPGLSQLERTLRNNPEYLTALTNRNQANRAAMTGALGNIAGTDADMAAAQGARSAASEPLYEAAKNVTVKANPELGALLSRPSMTTAWERAQQLAAENGESLVGANANDISGKTLQYLKMSLNDMANTGPQNGMGAHEVRALRSTLGSLNDWITANVPELRDADNTYKVFSEPINQMQVGGALKNRLEPALADFGNNTRLSSGSYANALRNGDQIAAQATGLKGAQLHQVLSADQMQTVTQIGQQLARRANADELGRAVGSNTGQNLVSQNVLRQFLGPFGLPGGWAERSAQSTLMQTVMRPFQFIAKAGENRVMDKLAEAALSPEIAKKLLVSGINPGAAQAIWARQGLLGSFGNSLAYASQK